MKIRPVWVFPIARPYGRPYQQAYRRPPHSWASRAAAVTEVGYGAPAERFPGDILREPVRSTDGVAPLPEGTGLGVEVDDAKLAKYAIPVYGARQ